MWTISAKTPSRYHNRENQQYFESVVNWTVTSRHIMAIFWTEPFRQSVFSFTVHSMSLNIKIRRFEMFFRFICNTTYKFSFSLKSGLRKIDDLLFAGIFFYRHHGNIGFNIKSILANFAIHCIEKSLSWGKTAGEYVWCLGRLRTCLDLDFKIIKMKKKRKKTDYTAIKQFLFNQIKVLESIMLLSNHLSWKSTSG